MKLSVIQERGNKHFLSKQYAISDTERVLIVKNCLGREVLQLYKHMCEVRVSQSSTCSV